MGRPQPDSVGGGWGMRRQGFRGNLATFTVVNDAKIGKRAMKNIQQLSLVKGAQRYVFRYPTGQEADVIGAFASLATDPESDFDWFDAAVLSYQMGRRLELELEQSSAGC
jgi:hypothetical protein